MRSISGWLVVIFLFLCGCGEETSSGPKFTSIPDDDPQLLAAMEKARSTLADFDRALNSPQDSQSGFAIKIPISDGESKEYMWLASPTFDGQKYHGIIGNEPHKVTGVELGSKRSVTPKEVADWMYVENGKLVGGYTVRVVRDKMEPKERAEFDSLAPFELE